MAKKKPEEAKAQGQPPETEVGTAGGEPAEAAVDQNPKVRKASDAVSRAEEELRKAREAYEDVRQKAAGKLKAIRQQSVGELIDGTLQLVKKYPGPGVILAGIIGFFLGRLFRR